MWRGVNQSGLLSKSNGKPSKGTGFDQPLAPHQHWHIDVSYIKIIYSFRRATTGSTRDARRAGMKQAKAATATRMRDTVATAGM
jgi:hypothetical protein